MQTKNVILLLVAALVIAAVVFFVMKKKKIVKKEKFAGNFSVDSGFYKVDHDEFGGSGFLSDPINQSRSG
jgi:hypothetical protein